MNNPFVDLRALIFSEQCVIVSGAGTPEVNGTYLDAGQYNSHPVFYKDKNAVLYWDGASWVLGRDGDDQYFGTATTHPWQATWTRGEGSLPAPIVRQGTAHDFEREIGKRTNPTLRGSAAEKNVGTGPDDVAAGDHTHNGDDVYLSAADEHGPVLLNGFNAGDGIYWPSNTSINARFVYLRRGGSGSTFGLFYQNDAWHQYFGATNTASILESSDPDGANFPWEAAWNHDVTRATAYDFHRHILEQLQFAGAPRPLAEVTGLQTALDGKASSAAVAALNADLATLGEGFSTLYNTVSELGVESITGLPEALTLKADLVNGLVPATQLPPLSYQTTRYDGDGTAFTFAPPGTLTNSDSPSAISVTINGVTQEPGSDYTLNIATNRVVLTSAIPLGDKIVITRPILLPSNSALTAEQLGALTATSTIDGGSF